MADFEFVDVAFSAVAPPLEQGLIEQTILL
jgi:hypothetical protein